MTVFKSLLASLCTVLNGMVQYHTEPYVRDKKRMMGETTSELKYSAFLILSKTKTKTFDVFFPIYGSGWDYQECK